jgi:hypothetical protein
VEFFTGGVRANRMLFFFHDAPPHTPHTHTHTHTHIYTHTHTHTHTETRSPSHTHAHTYPSAGDAGFRAGASIRGLHTERVDHGTDPHLTLGSKLAFLP